MKKLKTLLILILCFSFVVITTPTTPDYGINPCGHYEQGGDRF